MKPCVRATRRSPRGHLLPALLAAVLLSGCVIVPVGLFTAEPFPIDVRQQLAPGLADQDRVRLLLGPPTAHKAGGRYWFYARSRTTWGVIAGTSSAAFSEDHWLAVEFDDAHRVVFIEHSDHPDHCLSNGICMLGGLFGQPPSDAVLSAPSARDAAARRHEPGPETCDLYLFIDKLPWPYRLVTTRFSVNGQVLGRINDQAYLFLTHARGPLHIGADALQADLHCDGGRKLYVQAIVARHGAAKIGQTLGLVDETDATTALQARKLALAD